MLAKGLYRGLLYEILDKNPSFDYMEIGSFDGEGIVFLSKKFPGRKYYAIDPFIEDGHTRQKTHTKKGLKIDYIRNKFVKNVNGSEIITHYDMTSKEFMDKELYNTISPDILFIDGDHSFEGATLDLSLAMLFANKKRLFVVMDDTQHKSVMEAVQTFASEYPKVQLNFMKYLPSVYFYLPR